MKPRSRAPTHPGVVLRKIIDETEGLTQDKLAHEIGVSFQTINMNPGEDGYFVAECPALPGCASQGKTRDEALAHIGEAITGWLEVQADRAESTPAPAKVEVVEVAV